MSKVLIQVAVAKTGVPSSTLLRQWGKAVLKKHAPRAEITLRIVDQKEMAELNKTYRKKSGPTNVLSFPADLPEALAEEMALLGDIVICAEVVNREARDQHKPRKAHWAHMVIHGVYHLLGYDHETEKEAEVMENMEIMTLHELGIKNPYDR